MVDSPYDEIGEEVLKPLVWVGSSKKDLTNFPASVRQHVGFALFQAQSGLRHRDSKPLKGLGSNVLEVVSRHDGDTYRAVYTVRWRAAVYVLHAFQKKGKRSAETPKPEIDLIKRRLRTAEQHYVDTYGKG